MSKTMWDYAELSKLAKKFGGPVMFINTIFIAGRIYERREEITSAGIKIIESIALKIKEFNNKKPKIENFKNELISGIVEYDKSGSNNNEKV